MKWFKKDFVTDFYIDNDLYLQRGDYLIKGYKESGFIVGTLQNGFALKDIFVQRPLRDSGCFFCNFSRFEPASCSYTCIYQDEVMITDLVDEKIGRNCKFFEEDRYKTIRASLSAELTSLKYTIEKLKQKYETISKNNPEKAQRKDWWAPIRQLETNLIVLEKEVDSMLTKAAESLRDSSHS